MADDPEPFNMFDATQAELETFLFFSVAVAGKQAESVNAAVERFFSMAPVVSTASGRGIKPLQYIKSLTRYSLIRKALQTARLGQYTKLERFCGWWVAQGTLDLRSVSVAALEAAPGIGPKTARFFVMYTRRGQRYAVLDTHVLAWMRERGIDAPKSTPQSAKRYAALEKIYLDICAEEGHDPHRLDSTIWQSRTRSYK